VRPRTIAVEDVEFYEFSKRDKSEAAIWVELYSCGRRIINCSLWNLREILEFPVANDLIGAADSQAEVFRVELDALWVTNTWNLHGPCALLCPNIP
jgi:hypothetical protein